MKTGITNLEILAREFIRSCSEPKGEDNLLDLQPENFETVLASDDFCIEETKVYEKACRWAEKKCKEMNLEETTKNLRIVLGGSLFKVRFPLMSSSEFTEAMDFKRLLTAEERSDIYKFTALNKQQKSNFGDVFAQFPTKKRISQLERMLSTGILTMCLTTGYSIVNNPQFVCDGNEYNHLFATVKRIEMHGLGFLGPIDSDAYYDVLVKILKCSAGMIMRTWNLIVEKEKQIFAKKGQIFYFIFDTPIIFEPCSVSALANQYRILFHLKGPNTCSVQVPFLDSLINDRMFYKEENQFHFARGNAPLAEILFKKI